MDACKWSYLLQRRSRMRMVVLEWPEFPSNCKNDFTLFNDFFESDYALSRFQPLFLFTSNVLYVSLNGLGLQICSKSFSIKVIESWFDSYSNLYKSSKTQSFCVQTSLARFDLLASYSWTWNMHKISRFKWIWYFHDFILI